MTLQAMRQNGLGVGAGDATLLAKYFAKGGGSQVRIPLLNEVSPITVEREGGSISRCCCIYVVCMCATIVVRVSQRHQLLVQVQICLESKLQTAFLGELGRHSER